MRPDLKILFIVPLPPPITGQALACQTLVQEVGSHCDVEVVNFTKRALTQGIISFKRIREIVKMYKEVFQKSQDADLIYLTISQSVAGNIKDLIIYLICFKKISKMVVHLHGGGIKKIIFDRHKVLRFLNEILLRQIGGVVVLGKSLIPIFEGMVSNERIHIIANHVDDYLFSSEAAVVKKFNNLRPFRILFLSNLLKGKGYKELIEAFQSMDKSMQAQIRVDFAGDFEGDEQQNEFLNKIKEYPQVYYHGVVSGEVKKHLLNEAHVFCLPTYYHYYEGQPLSILEAYASGCFVLTTNHGGICDIFQDGINGIYVQKESSDSIKIAIERLLENPSGLMNVARKNREIAERDYRKGKYIASFLAVFEHLSVTI